MDKTPPVTTSTDAMDTEEGDAITKMILDKTKIRARLMQKRSRLVKGWDMELDDVPRPFVLYPCLIMQMQEEQWKDQPLPCHLLFSLIMRRSMMSS